MLIIKRTNKCCFILKPIIVSKAMKVLYPNYNLSLNRTKPLPQHCHIIKGLDMWIFKFSFWRHSHGSCQRAETV